MLFVNNPYECTCLTVCTQLYKLSCIYHCILKLVEIFNTWYILVITITHISLRAKETNT